MVELIREAVHRSVYFLVVVLTALGAISCGHDVPAEQQETRNGLGEAQAVDSGALDPHEQRGERNPYSCLRSGAPGLMDMAEEMDLAGLVSDDGALWDAERLTKTLLRFGGRNEVDAKLEQLSSVGCSDFSIPYAWIADYFKYLLAEDKPKARSNLFLRLTTRKAPGDVLRWVDEDAPPFLLRVYEATNDSGILRFLVGHHLGADGASAVTLAEAYSTAIEANPREFLRVVSDLPSDDQYSVLLMALAPEDDFVLDHYQNTLAACRRIEEGADDKSRPAALIVLSIARELIVE